MSFGRQALLGMLFVSAGVIATKLSSLVAQLVLGWLLAPQDYTMWGMLIALRMFVDGIRNGGALPVMQQQRLKSLDQAGVFFKYGLIFNLTASLVLLATAPLAQMFFQTSGLIGLIVLLAISFSLSTPGAFYRTQLSIDLRFRVTAKIVSICAVLNYGVMILCAILGLGPYTFVIPMIANSLAEWWLYGHAANRPVSGGQLTVAAFLEIFRASKWIILAATATAVATSGDYLVIGRLAPEILGQYLFGFQLTVAISAVIAAGFQQVLLPTYSRLQNETKRFAAAYRNSMIMTSLVASPLFALGAVLAPFMVHFLWAGKWDAAIPVVQAMSLCLVLRLLNPLSGSVLQASGRWDIFAALFTLDAVIVVITSWIGTRLGGLPEVAIAVAVGKCLIVPIMIFAAARCVDLPPWRTLGSIVARIALPMASTGIVWGFCGFPSDTSRSYLMIGVLTLVLAEAITMWRYRQDLRMIWRLLRRKQRTSDVSL